MHRLRRATSLHHGVPQYDARMNRWIVVLVLAGCSSKKEAPPAPDPVEKPDEDKGLLGGLTDKAKSMGGDLADKAKSGIEDKAKSMGGDLADKAKSLGGDLADKAKSVGGDVADKAKSMGGDLEDKAKSLGDDVARRAAGLSSDAVALGKQLKDQVRAIHPAGFDYDLAIESSPESEREHADRIRGMKVLKVGDYSVGYEQVAKHPLGKVYNWQFRVTWRLVTGQVVKLSLFTDEELPELELASLLTKLIPKADLLLK